MNNKANMMSLITTILMFSIVIFIFLFAAIGVHQIFSENLIEPSLEIANNAGITNTTSATITSYSTFYEFDFINYDLFFLVFIISAFSGTIYSAYRSTQIGMLSFFGYITIGSYVFFLALGSVTQISDYLITNFFYGLFDTTNIEMPIINFFINYIQIISFVWFLVILLVNQFNLIGKIKDDNDGGFIEE